MRGPSGRGARRLARAGVLEPYVEHGKQAQRSPGGRIVCFDRPVVRNAGYRSSYSRRGALCRSCPPLRQHGLGVFTNHESRNTSHGFYAFHESRITAFSPCVRKGRTTKTAVRTAVSAGKSLFSSSPWFTIVRYCSLLFAIVRHCSVKNIVLRQCPRAARTAAPATRLLLRRARSRGMERLSRGMRGGIGG